MAKTVGPIAPDPVLKVKDKVPSKAKAPTTPHESSPEFDLLGGLPHQFPKPVKTGPHGYRHENKRGNLRVSGTPGAHQIGRRK